LESSSPAQLVAQVRAGDRAAWDELVDRYSPMLWSIARSYRLSDTDANDVLQTTWLRLLEHVDSLRIPGQVGVWLATTARREALRIVRMQQREHLSDDELPLQAAGAKENMEAELLTEERNVQLRGAFRQLPPQCQRLLWLLATDPAPSYAEISAALGVPIGSIGPTRARCLDRLRRQLELVGVVASSEPREQALLASVHDRVGKRRSSTVAGS
jgi:RNA polymerase sigma factor (sigma-70 family)